jgi:hypothetical protein
MTQPPPPEDVGWDRVAVLSRAVWVAIVGIAAMGLIAYTTPFVNIMSRRLDKTVEKNVDKVPGLTGTLEERKRQYRRRIVQAYLSVCIVFAVGLLLVLQPHLSFASLVVCASRSSLMAASPS